MSAMIHIRSPDCIPESEIILRFSVGQCHWRLVELANCAVPGRNWAGEKYDRDQTWKMRRSSELKSLHPFQRHRKTNNGKDMRRWKDK